MASKEATNPFSNIKIKQEPGTSAAINIPGSSSRLKNIMSDRDLNNIGSNILGIKKENTKKKVAPNIANYQRRKKDESVPVVKVEATKTPKPSNKDRERGRGRGRGKPNIMSLGTLTEAPTLQQARQAGSRMGGSNSIAAERKERAAIERPVLDLTRIVDKEADEEILKSLYKDDFIDDGDDIDHGESPISLPILLDGREVKKETKELNKIESEEEIDQKPIILENGNAVMPDKKKIIKKKKVTKLEVDKKELVITPASVFETKDDQPDNYMLFVLPDSLPGFLPEDDVKPNIEASTSKNSNDDTEKKEKYCTMNDLNEGLFGKIQIHKSGKTYLKLGHNNLVVELGSHCSFKQDLIAAKLEGEKKDLVHLGSISNTVVCSPDWETMIANL